MVIIETLSMKEYSKIGFDLTIHYIFTDSQFGHCLMGIVQNAKNSVCHLVSAGKDKEQSLKVLQERWKLSKLIENNDNQMQKLAKELFNQIKMKKTDNIHIILKGTDFQLRVWKALAEIPFGSLFTYAKIAEMIDNPRATRAVASAIGANQVFYLIPCHRVICKNGCNKFSGPLQVKEKMQQFEKENIDN